MLTWPLYCVCTLGPAVRMYQIIVLYVCTEYRPLLYMGSCACPACELEEEGRKLSAAIDVPKFHGLNHVFTVKSFLLAWDYD